MNKLTYRLLSGRAGAGLEIRILMRCTAGVFGEKMPKAADFPAHGLLERYAKYTAHEAEKAIHSGRDLRLLRKELYKMAKDLGFGLRRLLRPEDEQECLAILIMIYHNIGIDIREESPGKIIVKRCYFSHFYTPEVCTVISAIDKGIFAGVYHGGRLRFSRRITEGHRECRADFK
ncbi:MAG: hypothetical protein LUC41_02885 [Clostridiales bacterium]|nr:hypothetical protein [Clostridiales bacterium]